MLKLTALQGESVEVVEVSKALRVTKKDRGSAG